MSFVSGVGRFTVAAALMSCLGFTLVQAAPPQVTTQVKSRQDKLRDMGGALKAITDELKKSKVDFDNVIIPNTQTIKDRSAYLLNWFPKGTGPETGVKTYALPTIWQKNDDFQKIGKAAQAEAIKLDQVANSRNQDALKAEAVAMGKACKACHDDYRSKDYEKENEE
jgi:cytochrome c556